MMVRHNNHVMKRHFGPMLRPSPHVCSLQQSSVWFTNTSPSPLQTTGLGMGHMMGSHSTLIVLLSQTHVLQPLCQVSPTCSRDRDVEKQQHRNWTYSVIETSPL